MLEALGDAIVWLVDAAIHDFAYAAIDADEPVLVRALDDGMVAFVKLVAPGRRLFVDRRLRLSIQPVRSLPLFVLAPADVRLTTAWPIC